MTTAEQTHTAPVVIEGSTRTMPVSNVAALYGLPAGTEHVLITADYRDVHDSRRDLKDVERGPVAIANLPRTRHLLASRGFSSFRFRAA